MNNNFYFLTVALLVFLADVEGVATTGVICLAGVAFGVFVDGVAGVLTGLVPEINLFLYILFICLLTCSIFK